MHGASSATTRPFTSTILPRIVSSEEVRLPASAAFRLYSSACTTCSHPARSSITNVTHRIIPSSVFNRLSNIRHHPWLREVPVDPTSSFSLLASRFSILASASHPTPESKRLLHPQQHPQNKRRQRRRIK